jgi:hypothetical protein
MWIYFFALHIKMIVNAESSNATTTLGVGKKKQSETKHSTGLKTHEKWREGRVLLRYGVRNNFINVCPISIFCWAMQHTCVEMQNDPNAACASLPEFARY